jgi:hypothetical protein
VPFVDVDVVLLLVVVVVSCSEHVEQGPEQMVKGNVDQPTAVLLRVRWGGGGRGREGLGEGSKEELGEGGREGG